MFLVLLVMFLLFQIFSMDFVTFVAVCGGEWGQLRDGHTRWGCRSSKGKGQF